MTERPLSYRALFAVVYTTSVSSVYFALGVVAHHANGLTPAVFLAAGIFFGLTAMTFGEGASLHQERGGSAVFARYAFNELVSFVAGWSIVLDYAILIAVTALTVPAYLAAFWGPIGHGALELAVALGVIAFVLADNVTGVSVRRLRRWVIVTVADLGLQAIVIVLGLVLVFHPDRLSQSINLWTQPTASDLAFALPIAIIAFTGLEAAASLAGEVSVSRQSLKGLVAAGVGDHRADLRGHLAGGRRGAPGPRRHDRARHRARQGAGAGRRGDVQADLDRRRAQVRGRRSGGAVGLAAAASSAMLGVARVGYSLATNRQIPSAIGRLHPRWGTPFVIMTLGRCRRWRAGAAHRSRAAGRASSPSARCCRSRSRICR